MIEISNISKKFKNQLVLDSINLKIECNEKVLFVGQNGAGKSSLMRVILGEYIADIGYVKIGGFHSFKQRQNALNLVSFVPQTPPPLKLSLSELIYFAKQTASANVDKIYTFCDGLEFDLKSNLKKPFLKLSGGMKQKFLIALAFSRDTKVMIFDEPTANLDPNARVKFREILKDSLNDKCFVFISHRLDDVSGLVNRVISMDLGKVIDDKNL